MLKANNSAPDTVAQVNTLRTDAQALTKVLEGEGLSVQPHGWMPDCLILESTGNIEHMKAFRDGLFYVQDPAARLAVQAAGLAPNMNILDCCSAPGGKSFAAALAMKNKGRIISCDIHSHKIELLKKGAERLGITIMDPMQQDASQFVPDWENSMDAVIADVPCSGLGVIRKKPDIRYKDPDTMKELPALQLQILKNQARYVRPGGVLLYSTCTLVRRENEGVVEKFLKANPEFSLEPLKLPAEFGENTTGMLTLVPGEHDTDGFFIARLRRRS